jgi:hypothetical protein
MYQCSSKRLYRKYYLKGVEGFINLILSNSKSISKGEIMCPCVKYKNRKFHHKDIVTVEKVSVEKYIVGLHMKKPYVPYETLLERLVG